MVAAIFAVAVLSLTNQARVEHNEHPLKLDPRLTQTAEEWSAPEPLLERAKEVGLHSKLVGENIAWGYTTPRSLVAGWMASPPHRANILYPRYRKTGISIEGRVDVQDFSG